MTGIYKVCEKLNRQASCRIAWASLFCVLPLLAVMGCQPAGPAPYTGPYGSLIGKVTLDGKAVPDRTTIMFTSSEGHAASGVVESGAYEISKVPVTTYKVAVALPGMAEDGSLAPGNPMKMGSASIPSKYMSPESSGATVTVGEDEEKTFDFVMKSDK